MLNSDQWSRPVIIGGVGGSGTRVVAELISHLGFYIGDDLNRARDNLWFLLLFKRPRWYRQARHDSRKIFTGLSLLSKVMSGRSRLRLSELHFLFRAALEISIHGHNYKGDGRGSWPWVRARNMVFGRTKRTLQPDRWGWKEPNSHVYLDHLAAYYSNIKYIHTIRHGLDMAFSENQQQLYNWGPVFGISMPVSQTDEPAASLNYWIKSNKRVMEIGQKLGHQQFLVVNFDRLCLSPGSEIKKIVSFLDIDVSAEDFAALKRIPQLPKSLGRYRAHDLGRFDAADLQALENLGFSIHAD